MAGIGKVGKHLIGHATDEGASIVATDVDPVATAWVRKWYPDVEVVADADALVRRELDIYAPCALGGALDDEVVEVLRTSIVCGGANNQLAHDRIDNRLADRGILDRPDYLVNAGGVIQVADERHGFSFAAGQGQGGRDPRRHPPRPAHRGRRTRHSQRSRRPPRRAPHGLRPPGPTHLDRPPLITSPDPHKADLVTS